MKKRLVYLILPVITLILEIIPYGAVLYFGRATEDGGTAVRELFSYFDLIPFGYANFAPLITAVFTCICVLFIVRISISLVAEAWLLTKFIKEAEVIEV